MARLKLSNIVSKNEVVQLLTAFAESASSKFSVEDEKGKALFGACSDSNANEYILQLDDEVFGKVKSDNNAETVADLLNLLLSKEAEKKKLGTEVLNLYQELNFIFNFSEKLAQLIEPEAIAQTALKEAQHLISSTAGIVALFDEQSGKLNLLASSGDVHSLADELNNPLSLLFQLAGSGQSEIINDENVLKEIKSLQLQSLIYSSLKVNQRVMGAVILFNEGLTQYTAGDLKLLTTLALQSSSAINSALLYEKNIREAREREEAMRRIHEITVKFVPREFIRSLGKEVITDVRLGDQVEREVTVLFSDIRDFTTLSEQMTPAENFFFVSSFNELMGPIIRSHNGFINQYLGDAIMAIFPGKAEDAVAAAVEMQLSLNEFNEERKIKNQSPIQIGIGMHTGPLIMGITGDELRLDATTISDTVNTAARIENLTKHFKASVILTNETLLQLSQPFRFKHRPLGLVKVKGKKNLLSIHECFSGNVEQQLQMKLATLDIFVEGMASYLDKSFDKAATAFQNVIDADTTDLTAKIFLRKATKYFNAGVPEDWMAVEENLNQ
jgi:adenylate cyclase